MAKNKVEVCDFDLLKKVKIFIDDIIHLSFSKKTYVGFQSWFEDIEIKRFTEKRKYVIEYYFSDTEPILTEYEDRELWEGILKQLKDI